MLFTWDAAAVSAQVAVFVDDAVTRDDDGELVGAVGAGDSASGGGFVEVVGELRVRPCLAVGNGA